MHCNAVFLVLAYTSNALSEHYPHFVTDLYCVKKHLFFFTKLVAVSNTLHRCNNIISQLLFTTNCEEAVVVSAVGAIFLHLLLFLKSTEILLNASESVDLKLQMNHPYFNKFRVYNKSRSK